MKTIIFLIATAMLALSIINYSYDLELSIAYFAAAIALYYSCALTSINAKLKSGFKALKRANNTIGEYNIKLHSELTELKTNSAKWQAAFKKERERCRLKPKRQRELKKAVKQSNK